MFYLSYRFLRSGLLCPFCINRPPHPFPRHSPRMRPVSVELIERLIDGITYNHCAIEAPWQETALSHADDGVSADLFWQLGTTLSTGQTHNDGNTIYTGSDDWTCLVTEHVAAIG